MSIQSCYRKIPTYAAALLAAFLAFCAASAITVSGILGIDFIMRKVDPDFSGPGAGVFIICAVPNIAIPSFIAAFSVFVNHHPRTSWRTPTVAFVLGAIATCIWIPSEFTFYTVVTFYPILLGTGAVAWLISCVLPHRRDRSQTQHAL